MRLTGMAGNRRTRRPWARQVSLLALGITISVGCSTHGGVAELRSGQQRAGLADPSQSLLTGQEVPPEPGWVHRVVNGDQRLNMPPHVLAEGGDLIAVLMSEDGRVQGFRSGEDGRFQAGEAAAADIGIYGTGGVVRWADGWLGLWWGARQQTDTDSPFEVRAFSSSDGLSWRLLDTDGFGSNAMVSGVDSTTDGRLLAVGSVYDESAGTSEAMAWRSADGVAWTGVPLAPGADGHANDVVVVGDRALVTGHAGGAAALWSSTDGGASWVEVPAGDLPSNADWFEATSVGDVVVLSGHEGPDAERVLVRSADAGATWKPVAAPPPGGRSLGEGFKLFPGSSRFFLLASYYLDAGAEPALCYHDIELCQEPHRFQMYTSDDGERWQPIDTPAASDGLEAVTETTSGSVVVARTWLADSGQTRVETWTWPGGVPLRPAEAPTDPVVVDESLPEGATPEIGRRYAHPLFHHCGIDWLHFADRFWERTDGGPGAGNGVVPAGWPEAQEWFFGYATLTAPDRLEYSLPDGEVIATYAPADSEYMCD